MATIQRSLLIVFVERYALIALQLAAYLLLARILTPHQVGIYAALAALMAIIQVIRDFGVATYVIQHENLDETVTRQALGVSYLVAFALFLGLNLSAGVIANYYDTAEIEAILRVMSLNLLIYPFNSVSTALLRRDLNFSTIAKVNVAAAVVGTSCTLALAWTDHGPISMALGELTSALVAMTGLIRARGWLMPIFPTYSKGREIFEIGGSATVAGIVTSASMNINDIAAGKILDFTQVGIASRAMGLMNLFHRDVLGTVRSVMFPAFAQAWRDGGNVEQLYVRTLGITSAFAWLFYGLSAIFPREVLHLMFGPQWDASAHLVPIYALAGSIAVLSSYIPNLMTACGRAKRAALADLIVQPIRAAIILAALWKWRSLEALACSYALSTALMVPYFYFFKDQAIQSNYRQTLQALAKSAALASASLLPIVLLAMLARGEQNRQLPLHYCVAMVALSVALWLIAAKVLAHPAFDEISKAYRQVARSLLKSADRRDGAAKP